MSIYVTRKCPNCKYTLESFERDYRALGPPLIKCPSCNQMIKRDNVTEWSLMSNFDKVKFFGILLYTAFIWGAGPAIILVFIINESTVGGISDQYIFLGIIIGWGLGIFYQIKNLKSAIEESNERLKDPKYRFQLKHFGFDINDKEV